MMGEMVGCERRVGITNNRSDCISDMGLDALVELHALRSAWGYLRGKYVFPTAS